MVNPARLKLDGDRLGDLIDALEPRRPSSLIRVRLGAEVSSDLRPFVAEEIRLHPRVAYQGLLSEEGAATRVAAALPRAAAVSPRLRRRDLDRRLGSPAAVAEPRCCASTATTATTRSTPATRRSTIALEQIAERDKYPEFDVPDFDGLAADEAYEIELSPTGPVGRCRLTSAWRRTVASRDATTAVALRPDLRRVPEAGRGLAVAADLPRRPRGGVVDAAVRDRARALDARRLVPARVRRPHRLGRSFLADLETKQIVSVRDFSVAHCIAASVRVQGPREVSCPRWHARCAGLPPVSRTSASRVRAAYLRLSWL